MSETALRTDVGSRFLQALETRDYEALGRCFAADGTLRAIVPPGVREADGREAIVDRFRIWTEDREHYEVTESDAGPFADLLRLTWVVKSVDPDDGPCAYEQTAYAEITDGQIVRMRLACSGDRRV